LLVEGVGWRWKLTKPLPIIGVGALESGIEIIVK